MQFFRDCETPERKELRNHEKLFRPEGDEYMGKIEMNKRKKKEAMLNKAFELFTTKGINDTSISDIVNKAGVAKGTFYLYFRDKYDVRNLLISHKSSQVFMNAAKELETQDGIDKLEDKIIFLADNILNQLAEDKALLMFISKNLSWGYFKSAVTAPSQDGDINFKDVYYQMLDKAEYEFKDPEIMIYMIVELVSSTCYSAILYNEPVGLKEIKPYLFDNIRHIIDAHKTRKKEGR